MGKAQTTAKPLDANLAEIDRINTPDAIVTIFANDVVPKINATGTTEFPRACLLVWGSTASFLRRLRGNTNDYPTFKEITLAEMRKLYPTSKALTLAEQNPKAVAVSCSVLIRTSIVQGQKDSLMNMSLSILYPPRQR